MRQQYKNYYRFRKPPQALLKARLDNIAIVPATMLAFKEILEEQLRTLPKGAVFLCYIKENERQRKLLEQVEAVFKQQGHCVTKRSWERAVSP